MKRDTIIILCLFIAIMLVTVWFSGSSAYIPYTSTIASKQAAFEGFHQRAIPLEYSNVSNESSAADDTYLNFSINESKQECKKVSGFPGFGVFCDPKSNYGEKIDLYSDASGSLTCGGFGYNNSKGGLCLDDKMKTQLSTRGGNSSGKPSVIAGSP
jgi:hypothetical protein